MRSELIIGREGFPSDAAKIISIAHSASRALLFDVPVRYLAMFPYDDVR